MTRMYKKLMVIFVKLEVNSLYSAITQIDSFSIFQVMGMQFNLSGADNGEAEIGTRI